MADFDPEEHEPGVYDRRGLPILLNIERRDFRDRCAMRAMQEILHHRDEKGNLLDAETIAVRSYYMADVMMGVRDREELSDEGGG